jgi:hypothetical protein
MFRYPLVRLVVGLSIGFFGAMATFFIVDRYGDDTPLGSVDVLGEPDYDRYCGQRPGELEAKVIQQEADGWRCIGLIDGFFVEEELDADTVCKWQFGVEADGDVVDESDPDGWRCIALSDG